MSGGLVLEETMRFGFRVADAMPREMSAGAFRVGDDPFSFVPSDTFGSSASVAVGFRPTELLEPGSPTSPRFHLRLNEILFFPISAPSQISSRRSGDRSNLCR